MDWYCGLESAPPLPPTAHQRHRAAREPGGALCSSQHLRRDGSCMQCGYMPPDEKTAPIVSPYNV